MQTKMLKRKIIVIAFFIFFSLMSSLIASSFASAAELTGDKKDVYDVLTQYYDTAKAKDIDKYMALQDTLYWEQVLGMDNYKTYVSAVFAATDIKDYQIISPIFLVQDNMSLVYYELKSTLIIKDNSYENKDIDNDMVAFLFKYPEGWKVRYIILREQFDYKMISGTLSNIAVADSYITNDNSSLKEQFLADGVISQKDLDNVIGGVNASSDNAQVSGKGTGIVWIIIAIVGVVILIFLFVRKKKHHKE